MDPNHELTIPRRLRQPWIYKDPPPSLPENESGSRDGHLSLVLPNADSSLGIGEDNVWRDRGEGV